MEQSADFPLTSHHPISQKFHGGRSVTRAYGAGDQQVGNTLVEHQNETEERNEAVPQGWFRFPHPEENWQ